MVLEIQSKEVIDKISEELKVQPSLEIPRSLAKDIQLTYDINAVPVVNILERAASVQTANLTIFTVPSDRAFFLTSVMLSVSKDASSDLVSSKVNATLLGKAQSQIMELDFQSLTASSHVGQQSFPVPLRLNPGSVLQLQGAFTVGTAKKVVIITGYTTDPL